MKQLKLGARQSSATARHKKLKYSEEMDGKFVCATVAFECLDDMCGYTRAAKNLVEQFHGVYVWCPNVVESDD